MTDYQCCWTRLCRWGSFSYSFQWRRYTRARVRSNDLAARSTPWLRPAYYFASVIVCFILTVKQSAALAVCVLRATTEKEAVDVFEEKVHPMTWLEDFLTSNWPGSFTAPVLAFAMMTCLATLVTWKWPGCLDVLAPPLTASGS